MALVDRVRGLSDASFAALIVAMRAFALLEWSPSRWLLVALLRFRRHWLALRCYGGDLNLHLALEAGPIGRPAVVLGELRRVVCHPCCVLADSFWR